MSLNDIHWWLYRFWIYRRVSFYLSPCILLCRIKSWWKYRRLEKTIRKANKLLEKWEKKNG